MLLENSEHQIKFPAQLPQSLELGQLFGSGILVIIFMKILKVMIMLKTPQANGIMILLIFLPDLEKMNNVLQVKIQLLALHKYNFLSLIHII